MKERIEELARGLFNSLSRDRYLTEKEMAMIAKQITCAVNDAMEEAARECEKLITPNPTTTYWEANKIIAVADCAAAIRKMKAE